MHLCYGAFDHHVSYSGRLSILFNPLILVFPVCRFVEFVLNPNPVTSGETVEALIPAVPFFFSSGFLVLCHAGVFFSVLDRLL
jgi:hypothetical protein